MVEGRQGGEYIGKEFKDYCLQTGVSLEYASTNTPPQIGMSERVGRTLVAMVRCMLADSGLPKSRWGELMFMAAFLGNRAPHSAIGMQSPHKMLKGAEPDLRLLRVIGARAFVHIETHTKKLELKAVEGRLVGYSNDSKSYRVYNPATRRITESRNVSFIETPSRLLPPPSEECPMQVWGHGQAGEDKGHNYITDDDFLRDLRDCTSMLNPLPGASSNHITAGGLSANPQVAELLERISEITRRDMLHEGASGLPQEGAPLGGAPLEEVLQEGALESPEQPVPPEGNPLEAPLTGSSPLQQRGHARFEVTPSVTRSGAAARSFAGRNTSDSSNSAHLGTIANESTLSELRRLGLYTKASLPDIAHQMYEQESTVEYAYAATNIQSRSAGEKSEIIPNSFKEAMTLPAKARRPQTRKWQA